MKKKSVASQSELAESLQDLYWTLHRHSKANSQQVTLDWLNNKDSDEFDSTSCISGYEFEKFMPKARKLIRRIYASKKVKA